MINCAHPTHFAEILVGNETWAKRIRGLRANASKRSHAELDNATDLDAGDPEELAALYKEMRGRLASLSILGGCCGTDHRHIEQIAIVSGAAG
jgi:S-methylmethionine-dependent homocysteine/selenocysteine methylase